MRYHSKFVVFFLVIAVFFFSHTNSSSGENQSSYLVGSYSYSDPMDALHELVY